MIAAVSLLLIDDDRELCGMMQQFFAESGYRLHFENDGRRGLAAAMSGIHSLIILDVMLPDIDGISVLEQVRRRHNTPILMLTARAQHRDRVQGLNRGADDYLVKPFDPDELLARVRAILRRISTHSGAIDIRVFNDATVDLATRTVSIRGERLALTDMEFDLLAILVRCAGRIVGRDELALALFDRIPGPHDRSLDVHVSNLRRKLGKEKRLLRTVRGIGYAFSQNS
jgi:DNA-binding response OmpR family regulator